MTYAAKYDLRYLAAPALNQGAIGSCSENAMSSALSIIEKQIGSSYGAISRLQSYYDYREAVYKPNIDTGTNNKDMLDLAMKKGLAKESSWAYDVSKFTVKPPDSVYSEAAQHKITGYTDHAEATWRNSPTIVDIIKSSLSEGKPLLLGFTLKTWFDAESSQHDIKTMLPNNSVADEGRGGHCVLIVGADDSLNGGKGGYIVQNSWGATNGDSGFYMIPYNEFPALGDNWWNSSTNNFNMMSLFTINGFEGHNQVWSKERIDASQMYISTLDRGADLKGLDYWANALAANTITKGQMADMILNSSEYISFHSGFSTSQKIEEYYLDTLGRNADSGGLAFWTNVVEAGFATLGTVFADISTQVYGKTGVDHDFYSNKVNLGMTYSVTYQQNNKSAIIHDALLHVTSDANQLEIIKVGMAHDLGII